MNDLPIMFAAPHSSYLIEILEGNEVDVVHFNNLITLNECLTLILFENRPPV